MPPFSFGKQVYCTFPGVRAAMLLEEYTDTLTYCKMLVNDAGILDRHIISRKLVHLGTQRDVFFGKRSGFHGTIRVMSYELSICLLRARQS